MNQMEEHLNKLVGARIIGILKDDFDETVEEYGEPLFALLVKMPNGQKYQLTILSDAEGNGAGFLDIMAVRD